MRKKGKTAIQPFDSLFGVQDFVELNSLCMGEYNDAFSVGAFLSVEQLGWSVIPME